MLYTLEHCQGNIEEEQIKFMKELETLEKKKDVRTMVLMRLTMEWALKYYKSLIRNQQSRDFTLEDILNREDIIREVFAVLIHDPSWQRFFSTPEFRMVREEMILAGATGLQKSHAALYGEEE